MSNQTKLFFRLFPPDRKNILGVALTSFSLTLMAFFLSTLFKWELVVALSAVGVTFWLIVSVMIWKSNLSKLLLFLTLFGAIACVNLLGDQIKSSNSLEHAIGRGDIPRIKKLISKGHNVNADTNGGQNMLTWAFWYPRPNKTIWSDLPIVIVTKKVRETKILNMVGILIDAGARINMLDPQGSSPLHYAVSADFIMIVKMLIEKGADVNLKNGSGDSPLHFAAGHPNNSQMIKLIIAKGADVNGKNARGNTPLHDSIYSRSINTVEAILKNGADVNLKNGEGKTPLQIALEQSETEIAEFLHQHGAKE